MLAYMHMHAYVLKYSEHKQQAHDALHGHNLETNES